MTNFNKRIAESYPFLKSVEGTSEFLQDFKSVTLDGTSIRGIYHSPSKRSDVYLNRHECLEDLINTCVHETIHHCITENTIDEDECMDIDQEHYIIHRMAWASEILV